MKPIHFVSFVRLIQQVYLILTTLTLLGCDTHFFLLILKLINWKLFLGYFSSELFTSGSQVCSLLGSWHSSSSTNTQDCCWADHESTSVTMPRSFLVKKAKYANDFGSSKLFYRQPSSPTEGETAPSAVHHFSSSISSNRFSFGKWDTHILAYI